MIVLMFVGGMAVGVSAMVKRKGSGDLGLVVFGLGMLGSKEVLMGY